MEFTKKQQEAIKRGECPYCGATGPYMGDLDDGQDYNIYQSATCLACEKQWTEIYTFSHAEPFDEDMN